MPVSAIETLMPIAAPPRTAEPAALAPGGSAFAPALEKAYIAEKPRETAPPAAEDDSLPSAADAAADSDGAAEERSDETAEVSETTPAEDTDQSAASDEDSSDDEVEISELASAVVAAGEAQAAAAAEQEAVAAEPLGEGVQVDHADEVTEGEGATTAPGDEEPATAWLKSVPPRSLSASAGENAEGDAKRSSKAKTNKSEEAAAVEGEQKVQAAVALDATDEDSEQTAVAPHAEKPELTELEADSQAGSEKGDSKSPKGEGVAQLKLPPIEQTAELAAAIERHVAMSEQSAGGAGDATSNSTMAPEAIAAPSQQRTAATLDRLAAASMRRGDAASSTEGGPEIDRPRFLQRVEGALRAAQQRDGRVQVRLAPPELGSLRIELSVQNGAMTAKLEAETPAARNALLDNLPALRDRLAEQNIRVEKFDVDIRRDSQGSGGQGNLPDNGGDRQEQGRRQHHAAQPQVKAPAQRTARTAAATATDAGLDVRI